MLNTQDVQGSTSFDYSSVVKNNKTTNGTEAGKTEQQTITAGTDSTSISPISGFLYNTKLNLRSSNASFDGLNLNFDLSFNYSSTESISTKGYYRSVSGEVNLKMNYTFEVKSMENGVLKTMNYLAEINYSAKNFNSSSMNKSKEKEDILTFLNRVIEKIIDIMNDDDSKLLAVVFDKDDLKDIAEIADPKMRDMVNQVINIALITARLKQMLKKHEGKEQENIILNPHRNITEVTTRSSSTDFSSDYSITVKEITADEKQSGTEREK